MTAAGLCAPLRAAVAAEPRFEPNAAVEDLRAFAAAVAEVGAEPFRTSSRAAFDAALAQAEAACSRPVTASEFYVALAGLAASLNDGHISVGGWRTRQQHDEAGGGEFPLRTAVDTDGALLVVGDLSDEGGVEPGTVIGRIDGQDARDVVARAIALHGGQTAALRRSFARTLDAIFLLAGPHAAGAPYDVELIEPDGTTRRRKFAAVTAKVYNERYDAKNPPRAPYADRGLRGGAAVCEYNSCEDAEKFRAFLTAFFERARTAKARGVVVDIRRNSGGNSSVNDELFPFVTTKPYRQFGGVRLRVSDRLKKEYGREKYVSIYGEEAWSRKDGELLEYPGAEPHAPRAEPLRFDGPSFLLIGTGTFSSAMSCASAAKAYGLMQLVGQETGEPVYSTGEIYRVTLARTGFGAVVTTKVFLPPKPSPNDAGVRPDIVVATTRADRRAGRDPVLERALDAVG